MRACGLRILVEMNPVEVLQHLHQHKRHLIVCELVDATYVSQCPLLQVPAHLLAEADTGSRVERKEDERVGRQVLVKALV